MLGLNICNIRLVGRLLFTNEKTGLCEPYIGLGVSTRNSFLTFVFLPAEIEDKFRLIVPI